MTGRRPADSHSEQKEAVERVGKCAAWSNYVLPFAHAITHTAADAPSLPLCKCQWYVVAAPGLAMWARVGVGEQPGGGRVDRVPTHGGEVNGLLWLLQVHGRLNQFKLQRGLWRDAYLKMGR